MVFCLFVCLFLHFSARGTASIQAVNELFIGDSQEEFQADGVTAELVIPSTNACAPTEHVGAHVNTPASGSPPGGIVDASSGANPSAALVNTLAGGSPNDVIADSSSGVIPPAAIANTSPGATSSSAVVNTLASGHPPDAIPPDANVNASSDANPSALVNTLASGSSHDANVTASSVVIPVDAVVDTSSDVIPPDAITDVSPGVSLPDALANLPSDVILPGGSSPLERSQYTIDQIVRESAEYCRQKGLANNPVEILRFYQTQVIEGRMLEVDDPTHDCSEGETNQIFVNRDKVLDTGMDEIKILTNKRLTLEVQFYGEVGSNNQPQGIIDSYLYS